MTFTGVESPVDSVQINTPGVVSSVDSVQVQFPGIGTDMEDEDNHFIMIII